MPLSELTQKIFNRRFRFIFLILILIEALSFSGYLFQKINFIVFFIICAIALFLSCKTFRSESKNILGKKITASSGLKYVIYIALAELFIGSKGYLFYFENSGLIISIRIALWLIILSVWLSGIIIKLIKKEKTIFNLENFSKSGLAIFLIFFIFIGFGAINGFVKNEFFNVFFDLNGWLYFLLIFPVFELAGKEKNFTEDIFQIFFACAIWLSFKTLLLLYIFSHNSIIIAGEIYRWVRTTGVGEITSMKYGFVRVFFQSHIFILISLFLILFIFNEFIVGKKEKKFWPYFSIITVFSAIIILNFSRSFWVGLALCLPLYVFLAIKKYGWKNALNTVLILSASAIVSIVLITAVIKFPYPRSSADFNLGQISERIKTEDEAGVSSRWALLPLLWQEIKKAPLTGQGFGATVTYKTSDPRVLETTAEGEYTTYAFEWGWLDIWLKLGLLGTLFYLFLLGKITKKALSQNNWLSPALALGLVFTVVTSFFSPYLNHPLGIGYLVLVGAIIFVFVPQRGEGI